MTPEQKLGRLKLTIARLAVAKTEWGAEVLRDFGLCLVDEVARSLGLSVEEPSTLSETIGQIAPKPSAFDPKLMAKAIKGHFFSVTPYVIEKVCREVLKELNATNPQAKGDLDEARSSSMETRRRG